MKCVCRNCGREYESEKARGDWRGYCTAKCQHEKAKALGYRKGKEKGVSLGEYEVLSRANSVGDVPTKEEAQKLRIELAELESSPIANPFRLNGIEEIKRMLHARKKLLLFFPNAR